MIIIPQSLPARIEWTSDNGKWQIVAKVDKEPYEDFLYSWILIQKLDKSGKWRTEYKSKHYPAYLKAKIAEFEQAIRLRKREYLEREVTL